MKVAALVGLVASAITYLLVAPFQCGSTGYCEGWVAWHYGPGSLGHWQAIFGGLVVGGGVAIILWAILSDSIWPKAVLTPPLLAGIGVSALSHSYLFFFGPPIGLLVLWLMWRFQPPVRRNERWNPPPFHSRDGQT